MVYLYGQHWTRAELLRHVSDMDQIGGIRAVALQDGPENGVRALEFRTGAGLAFTVLSDRAMDIGLTEINGTPVSYMTAAGNVHPAFFEAPGLNWLRAFQGGLFATCGLDSAGFPSSDAGGEFGLHGRVAGVPARAVSFDADWEGDDYVLRAKGKVRQASLHMEHLVLTREITAKLGENRIQIHDVVQNNGTRTEPHMLVYHFNTGFPLLGAGAELVVNTSGHEGINEYSQSVHAAAKQVHEPRPQFAEQVFHHDTVPGPDGVVSATVVNRAFRGGRGIALTIRYRKAELPYLVHWRNFCEHAYVMGVEPSNADIRGRAYNRERGTLPELAPGERREYHLEVEVADDPEGVARLAG